MFCPYCGRKFESSSSRFCPFCGQDLFSSTTSLEKGRSYLNMIRSRLSPEGDKHKLVLIVGILAIALMSAVIVALEMPQDGSGGNPINRPPSDNSIVVGDDSYIELSDDFTNGIMSAYMNKSGELVIYLDSEIEERYDQFTWVLRDDMSNEYLKTVKDTGEVRWTAPEVGRYTVLVYCYDLSESQELSESYMGTFVYYGDKSISFEWTYNGHLNRISGNIPLSDIVKYSSADSIPQSIRHGTDPSQIPKMIVTTGSVSDLNDSLMSCYNDWYGWDEYGYADFVLSFIQQCIGYTSDSVNHYVKEYWAFPSETLFNGCGDDEDVAILYASLMECAGYDTAIIHLPGKYLAAIALDDVDTSSIVSEDGYKYSSFRLDGSTYLVADASPDASGRSLGLVKDCYSYDRSTKTFYYYDIAYEGDYGAYVC